MLSDALTFTKEVMLISTTVNTYSHNIMIESRTNWKSLSKYQFLTVVIKYTTKASVLSFFQPLWIIGAHLQPLLELWGVLCHPHMVQEICHLSSCREKSHYSHQSLRQLGNVWTYDMCVWMCVCVRETKRETETLSTHCFGRFYRRCCYMSGWGCWSLLTGMSWCVCSCRTSWLQLMRLSHHSGSQSMAFLNQVPPMYKTNHLSSTPQSHQLRDTVHHKKTTCAHVICTDRDVYNMGAKNYWHPSRT